MSSKTFAPQYPRNEQGWVLFKSDTSRRKSLPFPDRVFEHPAKANLNLLEAIIDYISEPGETILDPFGGTGSLLTAANMGRRVLLIELEEAFQEMIEESLPQFGDGTSMLIKGDCRQILPIPCDHALFSPPYANILSGTGLKYGIGRSVSREAMNRYSGDSASALNLGRLSDFLYARNMEKVYQKLFTSIKPGGTMTIIIKDKIKGGIREFLSVPCIRTCAEAGFKLAEWNKWKAPGTAQQKLMASKGFDTVQDEDIITFKRP